MLNCLNPVYIKQSKCFNQSPVIHVFTNKWNPNYNSSYPKIRLWIKGFGTPLLKSGNIFWVFTNHISYMIYLCCRIYLFMLICYLGIEIAVSGFPTTNCTSEPRCRCFPISKNSIRADCSYLNLTRFPDFTEDVAEITFSHNNLTSIFNGTELSTGVKRLDISHCQLRSIEKGFIRPLQHLEYLDISHNRELSLEVLPNVTFDLQFV